MSLAIVLCSGGTNSAVAAMLARQRHSLILLHAHRPGSPDESARKKFDALAADLRPQKSQVLGVPLCPVSAEGVADARRLGELLPLVGVAGRFAQQAEATAIYVGLRAGPMNLTDGLGFVQVWEELVSLACGRAVKVEAPLLELEPPQVRELAEQLEPTAA
jgi:7-cyano-7-deazaguanine synthase in queuosine biosynthesis